MVLWILVSLALIAGIGGVLARRDRRDPKVTVAEELFEGLLPSAATGHPDRPPEGDGWGLRWADAVNLTADAPSSSMPGKSKASVPKAAVPSSAESTPGS
jgi:hypothetical protein